MDNIIHVALVFLALVMSIRQAILVGNVHALVKRHGRVALGAGFHLHLLATAGLITAAVLS